MATKRDRARFRDDDALSALPVAGAPLEKVILPPLSKPAPKRQDRKPPRGRRARKRS